MRHGRYGIKEHHHFCARRWGVIPVDADALSKAAMYVEVPADLIVSALKWWQTPVRQIGPARGNGVVAEQLSGQYAGPADRMNCVLSGLVFAFKTVGGTVQVTANNVADTELIYNA